MMILITSMRIKKMKKRMIMRVICSENGKELFNELTASKEEKKYDQLQTGLRQGSSSEKMSEKDS